MTNEHLFIAIQQAKIDGDVAKVRKLQERAFKDNIGLARSVARRFSRKTASLDYDDLLQECLIELWRDVQAYDLSSGNGFSTFVYPCLCGVCKRALWKAKPVHSPVTFDARMKAIAQFAEAFEAEHGTSPSREDLAAAGFRRMEISNHFERPKLSMLSIDASRDGGPPLEEVLSFQAAEIEGEPVERRLSSSVQRMIDDLPPKERAILLRRAEGDTLRQIGKLFGVSGEAVRGMEGRILQSLRARLEAPLEPA